MNASTLNNLDGLIGVMTLASRIQEALDGSGMSPAELARATKKTNSAVSQWLDGQTKSIKGDTAVLIEMATGYRSTWLVTGKGAKKADLIGLPERASEIDFSIPLLSWARAGAFCEAAGQFTLDDAEEMLPRPLQSMGKTTFALTVKGDSMDTPDGYREGEIVYIDPSVTPTSGKDVLAKTGDDHYTLKRYKEDEDGPYLLQLNGNKIIRPDTHWSVCGVVVFSGRKR